MTEYDYSPAAYERYLAQQARVSNWVSDTLQQSHAYANPFVLSPTLRDRSFYDDPGDPPASRHRPAHYADQWSNGSSRPSRTRSRSYDLHHDRAPPSRHRSQSQSRSPPSQRDVHLIYPHGPQPHYPQPHGPARTPASRIYASPPHHQSSRQAYVTQPPPGQIYQLSPNAHPPKDTLYRQPSHSRHASSKPSSSQPYLLVQGGGPKAEYKHGPPIHAPVPIKPHGGQQPLLKRLLGFMSPVGGRSGNGRGNRGTTY